ncbi:MAG: PLDc N-terminal domain-containing protein, partial [Salinibacterium sp.]|nr:PLDc N-terminal domain-containing protein [Salinibacterium sp.]
MWQSILIVAVPLLDIWTIGRAILRGHGVQGTIAWVMTIIAFPVFGALLYFALASPSVKRLKIRKQRAAQTIRATVGPEPEPAVPLHPLMDLAASLTDMEPTSGNEATLLAENDLAFRAIEEAMEAAEHRIWAEYYMVRNDETGHRFLDILLERARAGVEVLFIHDAVGSAGLDASRLDSIRDAGGQVVAFHPVNPLKHRWSVHLRNHKKLVIVDDTIGFTGGMNVGDEYSGRRRFRGKASFRDTHLMIRGPAVHDLARTFLEDW